jgi:S1-C subfamily serine protease
VGIAAAVISNEEQVGGGLSSAIPIDSIKEFLKQNGIKH